MYTSPIVEVVKCILVMVTLEDQ